MSIELLHAVAEAADEKKASRIVALDLQGKSDVCDYKVICSGENERQTRAIADAIEIKIKKTYGLRTAAVEGKQTGNWILLDFGSVIVHIFVHYLRDYYALEKIWPQANHVSLPTSRPFTEVAGAKD